MPGLELYELRHRALQWMIKPQDNGDLSLDIQTTARIAGHGDGGYLVCSLHKALTATGQRSHDRSHAHLPTPHREQPLRVKNTMSVNSSSLRSDTASSD